MNEKIRAIGIRLLREQEVVRTRQNGLIRHRFGDRITIALNAECAQRDDEIKAIEATIALLEAVETTED